MRGKLIVIEGTDGSGKATQSKELVKRLSSEGKKVVYVEFPQYGNPSAAMVEEYLNGRLGTAEQIGPYRASIFFAVDRYGAAAKMHAWLAEGTTIICNRYTTANKGHQAGKLKDTHKIDAFCAWVDHLEYEIFGIPHPDKVILLHMPHHIGQKLVDAKAERSYLGDKKRDIHEDDADHLRDAENAYLYVAEKEGWELIECSDGKQPLPIQDIHKQVYAYVKKLLE